MTMQKADAQVDLEVQEKNKKMGIKISAKSLNDETFIAELSALKKFEDISKEV